MTDVLAIRRQWCRPGEPILWCVRSTLRYRFEVTGLDANGNPERGWGSRAVRGVGGAVGGGILSVVDAAMDGDDDGSDYPPGFLTGPAPDCAAVREFARVPASAKDGFWVLTPHRLARLTTRFPVEADEEDGSWLGGAMRFGKGALKFAREVGDIVTSKPEHEPGVPVPVPDVSEHAVIDRSLLAGFEAYQRKLGRAYLTSKAWYLRIRFTDGSAMEISPNYGGDPVQRLVAMSEGRL